MLNLEVQTILEIPTRLKVEYNITPDFLATIMHKYSVQTVGKQTIEQQYKIVPPKATVPSTRHYSWPKAAGEHQMRLEVYIQLMTGISQLSWASAKKILLMSLSTTMPGLT